MFSSNKMQPKVSFQQDSDHSLNMFTQNIFIYSFQIEIIYHLFANRVRSEHTREKFNTKLLQKFGNNSFFICLGTADQYWLRSKYSNDKLRWHHKPRRSCLAKITIDLQLNYCNHIYQANFLCY